MRTAVPAPRRRRGRSPVRSAAASILLHGALVAAAASLAGGGGLGPRLPVRVAAGTPVERLTIPVEALAAKALPEPAREADDTPEPSPPGSPPEFAEAPAAAPLPTRSEASRFPNLRLSRPLRAPTAPGAPAAAADRPGAPPERAAPAVPREPPPAVPTGAGGPTHGPRSRGPLSAPRYPALAQRRGWQGLVVVLALVDATGRVVEARVAVSSGRETLDEAALDASRGWRFAPARRDGRPVPGRVEVPVRFALE